MHSRLHIWTVSDTSNDHGQASKRIATQATDDFKETGAKISIHDRLVSWSGKALLSKIPMGNLDLPIGAESGIGARTQNQREGIGSAWQSWPT